MGPFRPLVARNPIKRIMKKSIILYMSIIFLIFHHQVKAQEIIAGSIDNWQKGEARIVLMDMFSGYIKDLGKINKDGHLEIPLEKDFLSRIKEEMKKEQAKAHENHKLSLKTLEGKYSCLSGDLEYENPETNLSGLPKQFFIMQGKNEMLGILMPTSNPAIAESHAAFSSKSSGKGKYVEWVYFDKQAKVNGECYSNRFADSSTFKESHQFNLDFNKGWNLVQHEIQETFEDQSGKIHAKKIRWSTIEQVPEDIEWIFIPHTR